MDKVPWNPLLLEEFTRSASLTQDEEKILRTRVAGYSRVKQAMELNVSISTVDRIIRNLKRKYADAQNLSPLLPEHIKF